MLLLRECRESETSLAMEQTLFVSVIIPTYNRLESLQRTIDSFLLQSYRADFFEIIVSDNNSTDSTAELVGRYVADHPRQIRYLKEPRQGVHYARNSAAKIAKGDILYFTDDDMIADAELLMEIVRPFAYDPKVASVTGKVLPRWEILPPDWILKHCLNGWLSLQNKPEDLIISKFDCGVYSCHQAIRRDVFFQTGGFNPENTAGEWIGDGETGLNIKIREMGYKFAYIGSSVTHHIIPPSRITQVYLNKRLANQGNCDSYTDYRRHKYSQRRLVRRILGHTKRLLLDWMRFIIKFTMRQDAWRLDRAWINYHSSRIKYDWRLLSDPSWRDLVLRYDWLTD